jgi:hypothetical protein
MMMMMMMMMIKEKINKWRDRTGQNEGKKWRRQEER